MDRRQVPWYYSQIYFARKSMKNILIIGATGGIGAEFVRQFLAKEGVDRVFATYRTEETDRWEDDRLTWLPLDITEESQITAAVATMKETIDTLDCAINCVGILHDDKLQPEKSLRQIDGDRLLKYFQINSIGAILLAKHLQPLFKHQRRSILVAISAKVGSIGDNELGGWYGYRASKAALNMLWRTAAIEYKRTCPQTIVATLHPGTTDTNLSQPFQKNVPPDKLFTPTKTVSQLLAVIEALTTADSGYFFNWNGDRLPW
jgi:NAD(P)-dependent dehydrogenase (short-subunit alcohol dehydrogenase family)